MQKPIHEPAHHKHAQEHAEEPADEPAQACDCANGCNCGDNCKCGPSCQCVSCHEEHKAGCGCESGCKCGESCKCGPNCKCAECYMDVAPKYKAEWYQGTDKLKDQVAIITGGDSCIGRSVSCLFAREGCKIVIAYLTNTQDADETKRVVEEEEHSECLLIQCDVNCKETADKIVQQTMDKFGRIDVLVNCAGSEHAVFKLEDLSEAELERTFGTNIFGVMYMCQAVLPIMRKQKSGCIINTGSVTSYDPCPVMVDHDASKGAVISFSRGLAKQVAEDNIRVNCVAPGLIWTPYLYGHCKEEESVKHYMRKLSKHTPMQRLGHPEDVAPTYVFLASRMSSYFTGQTLHPNGGMFVHT